MEEENEPVIVKLKVLKKHQNRFYKTATFCEFDIRQFLLRLDRSKYIISQDNIIFTPSKLLDDKFVSLIMLQYQCDVRFLTFPCYAWRLTYRISRKFLWLFLWIHTYTVIPMTLLLINRYWDLYQYVLIWFYLINVRRNFDGKYNLKSSNRVIFSGLLLDFNILSIPSGYRLLMSAMVRSVTIRWLLLCSFTNSIT